MRRIVFLVFIAFVFILSGCDFGSSSDKDKLNTNMNQSTPTISTSSDEEDVKAGIVSESEFCFGSLKLGMKYEEFEKTFKNQISKTEYLDETNNSKKITLKDNAEVWVEGGKLTRITVSSQNSHLPKGLRVGDSIEKMYDLYGRTFGQNNEYLYVRNDEKADLTIGYSLENKIEYIMLMLKE